jgi:hypothetical protein
MIKYVLFTFNETSIDFFGIKYFGSDVSYSDKIIYISIFAYLLSFCIFLVILFVNYKLVVNDYKNNDLELLYKKVKRIKLGLIPFWIINIIFIVLIIFHIKIFLSLMDIFKNYNLTIWYYFFIFFGFLSTKKIEILCYLYLNLVLSSIFSIIFIKLMKKNNFIQKKNFIYHIIKQLIFIFDVVDILKLIKKWEKSNVA